MGTNWMSVWIHKAVFFTVVCIGCLVLFSILSVIAFLVFAYALFPTLILGIGVAIICLTWDDTEQDDNCK